MVEEQMARADVGKAEKDLLRRVLGETPGDSITATDLMTKFKLATGDHTLTVDTTSQYGDYGLGGIGRGHIPAGTGGATTNLYRLPEHMELSDANHFNDSRLFGWTRSFTEKGIRNIVELQSDLAQHTKVLSPAEVDKTYNDINTLKDQRDLYSNVLRGTRLPIEQGELNTFLDKIDKINPDASMLIADELRGTKDELRSIGAYFPIILRNAIINQASEVNLRLREAAAKLANASAGSQISPMIKHWPRRLIREELGRAAENGEPVVRFATADTVAKVEGWPDTMELHDRLVRGGESEHQPHPMEDFGDGPITLEEIKANFKQGNRFAPEHQSIYDRYQKEITPFLKQQGGKEVTDQFGHTWNEVPTPPRGPKQMYGHANTTALKYMAGAGLGALVGAYLDPNKIEGAALGMLAGVVGARLPATRGEPLKQLAQATETGLGIISTRAGNIHPAIKLALRKHEMDLRTISHDKIAQIDPFLQSLQKLKGADKAAVVSAVISNNAAKMKEALAGKGDALQNRWKQVRETLDNVGTEMVRQGLLNNLRPDYFPLIVIDRKGLLKSLDLPMRTRLERILYDANKTSLLTKGRELDSVEASALINKHIMGREGTGGKPGFLKSRVFDEITPEMEKYYASPAEALHTYLARATQAVTEAQFFGKHMRKEGGTIDTEGSIGSLVQEKLNSGEITPDQAHELGKILSARFTAGNRSPLSVMQTAKNIAYTMLIANPVAAVMNLSDVAASVTLHGLRPTMGALVSTLLGKGAKVNDFGLANHISEEFTDVRRSARVLNTMLKVSGFAHLDRFGKEVNLQAAFNNARRLTKTTVGQAELARKYQAAFGEDFPQLMQDLKEGKTTDNTRLMMFSELSDLQPISKSEVPAAYLTHPNGQILYILKGYILKQADLVRTRGWHEIKKGDRASVQRGLTMILRYGIGMGLAGAGLSQIQNWMLGRPIDFETADIPENFLKNFGWSKYMMADVKAGRLSKAAEGIALPPWKIMDDIISKDPKAISYLPVAGRILYARSFGGNEKYAARKIKEQRAADRVQSGEAARAALIKQLKKERQ